ncbi:hypothetical protein BDF14DRAFT_1793051 [Spinellus fusiger]|nr:hypothetical protein BDF14DRAFT_1793051 [Spinellus fusiger]
MVFSDSFFLSSNRCSNQNCFENCGLAATLNFRHILMSQREDGTRPERFCR